MQLSIQQFAPIRSLRFDDDRACGSDCGLPFGYAELKPLRRSHADAREHSSIQYVRGGSMSSEKGLIVDLQEKSLTEEAHRRIVVDAPTQSFSMQKRFYFGQYDEPFLETPEHSHPHHEIVILHFEEATPVEFALDGKVQVAKVTHSTTLFPAALSHQAKCDAQSRFSILTLDLAQISLSAYEETEGRSMELQPQLTHFDPVIGHIEQLLELEMQSAQSINFLYVDSLMTALSVHLLKKYTVEKPRLRDNFGNGSSYQLRPAVDYMHEHLEETLSLERIAQVVGMSRYHFIRCFKQAIGISPHQYLLRQRVDRAKQLLQNSQMPLSDIADSCGFSNQSHFTTSFKQQTGATPRHFRQCTQQ
ncbi:helix-turn-helix domain-containing protein [Leptolyngbya sp. AN03gr2]|uniref:helix-turn-helix domain-containing protein n=1 Tax=unclassified Leptolyngbya TaxID=2650499 RepID=UPI003D31793A